MIPEPGADPPPLDAAPPTRLAVAAAATFPKLYLAFLAGFGEALGTDTGPAVELDDAAEAPSPAAEPPEDDSAFFGELDEIAGAGAGGCSITVGIPFGGLSVPLPAAGVVGVELGIV